LSGTGRGYSLCPGEKHKKDPQKREDLEVLEFRFPSLVFYKPDRSGHNDKGERAEREKGGESVHKGHLFRGGVTMIRSQKKERKRLVKSFGRGGAVKEDSFVKRILLLYPSGVLIVYDEGRKVWSKGQQPRETAMERKKAEKRRNGLIRTMPIPTNSTHKGRTRKRGVVTDPVNYPAVVLGGGWCGKGFYVTKGM